MGAFLSFYSLLLFVSSSPNLFFLHLIANPILNRLDCKEGKPRGGSDFKFFSPALQMQTGSKNATNQKVAKENGIRIAKELEKKNQNKTRTFGPARLVAFHVLASFFFSFSSR